MDIPEFKYDDNSFANELRRGPSISFCVKLFREISLVVDIFL